MAYIGNSPAAGIISGDNIQDGTVRAADLASGAAVGNLGYTPVNKAGDTITGQLFAPGINLTNGSTGFFGASKFLMQGEEPTMTRGYACGPDASTFGQLQLYRATSTGSPQPVWGFDQAGRVTMPSQPAFAVGATVNGLIASGATCPFNTVAGLHALNIGGHYSTANSRFTAPVAGRYFFSFSIYSFGGNTGSFNLAVNGSHYRTGGDVVIGFKTGGDGDLSIGYSAVINLNAGDYVDVQARPGVGSSYMYGPHSAFTGYLIG